MDSRDPVVVFFEKSIIQSITLLRKWDFWQLNFAVPHETDLIILLRAISIKKGCFVCVVCDVVSLCNLS